jgi:hypothetical protein
LTEIAQILAQDTFVQEDYGIQRLVLCGCGNTLFDSQIGEILADLVLGHV